MPLILIVDDQPIVRKALRRYFEDLGLECKEAENGLDALQKVQHSRPDLIILGFSMPVMNGLEAARVFRQIMPEVPIFMLTAHCGVADEVALGIGISAIFAKDNVESMVAQARTLLAPPLT